METDDMPLDLRLAAIITLLSSSALRGATANKTAALQSHLEAAAFAADEIGPHLKDALEQTLAKWHKVHCHSASISVAPCLMTAPSKNFH